MEPILEFVGLASTGAMKVGALGLASTDLIRATYLGISSIEPMWLHYPGIAIKEAEEGSFILIVVRTNE